MAIQEVLASHTPNSGRLIWNTNDRQLEVRLNALALNVKAAPYNATGDGIADDQPAIQAAINDCYQLGGGYVFIPAGTYLLKTGSLMLKDGVNIMGAGMYVSTLKLSNGVNKPVMIDASVGVSGAYAFGRVYLANFGIDGNRTNNPKGQEGIATTAYYSTFENLYIHNCQTHGLRIGSAEMANEASQDRIVGCRITHCGDTGVYLDIKGIDHTVSESYIHDCDYGVVINNGGIRVINNDIFGNNSAGIQVKQTPYGLIIAANDLNANRRHGIHITRTTYVDSRPWSHILIANNSILGDNLQSDNTYDGIYVATSVPAGISKLTIVGNKVFTLGGPIRYRYGINLENNIVKTKCSSNHINNVASAQYYVGSTCSEIEIDSIGGGVIGPPPMPNNGTAFTNPYHAPATVYVNGGIVTAIAINDSVTGLVSGSFRILAGQTITLTYSAAPTWTWFVD